MANQEHLRILRGDAGAWNGWRQAHPGIMPDLSGADLSGADLRGADLTAANLAGADLRKAEGLTEEQINSAHGDRQTMLPEGMARPERWLGIRKVNLAEAFASFPDHWRPRILGDINDVHIKAVKVLGEFVWHRHDTEDELFLVTRGRLLMRFREREVWIEEGEFLIVPHGVEHQPFADQECEVVLIEPGTTLNTGNVRNERTVAEPERL